MRMKLRNRKERRANEDFWLGYLVALGLCIAGMLVFSVLFPGCATVSGLSGEDAELVAEHSLNIGRIESTAEALGDTISDSRDRLEIVRRASERIGEAGERLDYLFSEYEREVERLLNEVDSLRAREEAYKEAEERERGNKHNVLGPAGFVYSTESTETDSILNKE